MQVTNLTSAFFTEIIVMEFQKHVLLLRIVFFFSFCLYFVDIGILRYYIRLVLGLPYFMVK